MIPLAWLALAQEGGGRSTLPFRDPFVAIDPYWLWMMLPLVLAIAVVYKAIKLNDLSRLPREAATLALQITAFMVGAAASVWFIVEYL